MLPSIELDFDQSSIDALAKLENRLQAKAYRRTLTEIAKPIRKEIKEGARKDTGRLRRFISYKTTVDRKNNRVMTSIGLNYKKNRRDTYVAGVMQEIGNKYTKSEPFIEPVEQGLDLAAIEADMTHFIQMQIDDALAGR